VFTCVTCQVYLSARNGAWCIPRVWDSGLPLDVALISRFTTYVGGLLPSRFSSQFQTAANSRFDHSLYGLQPNHGIMADSVIVNDDLPRCIISGSVQMRPGVARLTSSGVQFSDGTYVDDIAAVICATGWIYDSNSYRSIRPPSAVITAKVKCRIFFMDVRRHEFWITVPQEWLWSDC